MPALWQFSPSCQVVLGLGQHLSVQGKVHAKLRPGFLCRDFDPATMRIEYLSNNVQTQTRSFPRRLCGKKGCEIYVEEHPRESASL